MPRCIRLDRRPLNGAGTIAISPNGTGGFTRKVDTAGRAHANLLVNFQVFL